MKKYAVLLFAMLAFSSVSFAEDQPTAKTEVEVGKGKVGVSVEVDCTKDPKNEKCTQKTGLSLEQGGIGLQMQQQNVTAVKEPPSDAYNFSLLFGMTTGAGSGASANVALLTLNLELGLNALFGFGKKFPGAEGGDWGGLLVAPSIGMLAGMVTFSGGDGEIVGSRLGATFAYEYLHFGPMNPETLEQGGWGLQAGLFVGQQKMEITTHIWALYNYIDTTTSSSESSVGPSLGIVFPKYNAGTAHLTSQEIRLMYLPTGDFNLLMLTGTWAF